MFAKQDRQFDEMAADPERRRSGIAAFTSRRNLIFWCAMVVSLLALAGFLIPGGLSGQGAGLASYGAAMQWMLVFKFESDLRLLRVIERLHSGQTGNFGA